VARSKDKEKFETILDAAQRVFAQSGFHGSQVSRIAKEAGVADGTIYIYFKNKEDILIALFRDRLGRLIQKFEEQIAQTENAVEALETICRTHYTELEQNVDMAYVTQIELRQSSFELRKAIGQTLKPYIVLIERVLKQGIEEGYFDRELDVKLTRLLLFGAVDEVVTSWLISGRKYSLSQQAEGTIRFFIRGIGAH
jgi:TetR/AcrR family fatty acid metabolism transcriptional regulator